MQMSQRDNFLDVVEPETQLGQVGQGAQGGAGHLAQVIVVEIEDPEVVKVQEGVLGDGLDPVLAQVQLLHRGQATERSSRQSLGSRVNN